MAEGKLIGCRIPSMASAHKISKALRPLFIKYRPTLASLAPFSSSKASRVSLPSGGRSSNPGEGRAALRDGENSGSELLRSLATGGGSGDESGDAIEVVENNCAARAAVMVRRTVHRKF
ncbi:hypothetical protein M5K25_001368 [Dendrobium thyrsiflorum]|uniref:Uncharacterized protein n=1 Tax=Dendrobium thyrsiflorum TaxID=117978 RepID=A0ABD0VXE1_DENTH